MTWFYLALLAPLFYAIVNLFDDNLLAKVYKSPYLASAFAGLFGTVPLIALFFRPAPISLHFGLLAATCGFLTILYYFFYFKALELEVPSVVVALLGLAPAALPFFAYFMVHERLAPMAIVGFIIVLLASIGLAAVDIKNFKFSAALVPALIAVLIIDILSLLTKHVYDHAQFFPAYMCFSAGMGIASLFFLSLKPKANAAGLKDVRKIIKKVLPIFVAAELTSLAAEFTLNLAISRGPVSLVKVIEGIQPIFVLLIALALYPIAPRFFREAEDGGLAKKFGLMAAIVVGLVFISYSTKV